MAITWAGVSGPVLCIMLHPNFREYPFRNCLENRVGPDIGVPKAAEGVERAPIGRFLPPKKRSREAFGYFPNSFSMHFGE